MKTTMAMLACMGAVIGAGFASGREIVAFFSRYGAHAGWLTALACTGMALMCFCTLESVRKSGRDWCGALGERATYARCCAMGLMVTTGGAMTSAAGHMVALLWANQWAYALGAVGTLALAWRMGRSSVRCLGWLSGALTALLVLTMVLCLCMPAGKAPIRTTEVPDHGLWLAAGRALCYAALNMALALGTVSRCAGSRLANERLSVGFGVCALLVTGLGSALYARHPELTDAAFPIVVLLRDIGRRGFVTSVTLLYLSILTTLIAVLGGLRSAVRRYASRAIWQMALGAGPVLAVSCMGFAGIVERLYAPAGAVCLLLIFVPMMRRAAQRGT